MSKFSGIGDRLSHRLRLMGYWKNGRPDVARFCREKGYRPQYLYAWLKNRLPGPENLDSLSRDLEVSGAWILFGEQTAAAVHEAGVTEVAVAPGRPHTAGLAPAPRVAAGPAVGRARPPESPGGGEDAAHKIHLVDFKRLREVTEKLSVREGELGAILHAFPDLFCRLDADGIVLDCKAGRGSDFPLPPDALLGKRIDEMLPAPAGPSLHAAFVEAVQTGALTPCEFALPARGSPRTYEARLIPLEDRPLRHKKVLLIVREISERKRAEMLLAAERGVLEMLASGAPHLAVLEVLARAIEELSGEALCSILLLDPDGIHLRHGAAPSLPEAYVRGVDGIPIGPCAGSCGTAAFRKGDVIVADVATDPLWAEYRDLAARHGLAACWSTPIFGTAGTVLGTFAMYYRRPGAPATHDLQLVQRASDVAGIAIERGRAEEALRASGERQALILRSVPMAVYTAGLQPDFATTTLIGNAPAVSGFPAQEFLEDSAFWPSRLHPDDRDRVQGEFGALAQRGMVTSEYRWRHADGAYRWFLDQAALVRDAHGNPKEMVGTWLDITHRKRAEEGTRALVEVGRLLTETVDLDRVLGLVVETAAELLQAPASAVFLIERFQGGMRFEFRQSRGLPPSHSQGFTLADGEGIIGKAIHERRPAWTADILNDPDIWLSVEIRQRDLLHGIPRALLAAPLMRGEAAIGALVVLRPTGSTYEPREVQFLAALASQAAVAIENARLFEAASQSAEEAAAIHDAGQAVAGSLDLNATLGRIAESARRLSGAERTFLWLVDPGSGSLKAGTVSGAGAEHFLGAQLPLDGPSAVARAAREARPIAVEDTRDPAQADPVLVARFGNAAFLAIPLQAQGVVHGVLGCGYDAPRAFSATDVRRPAGLAQQAAIAIENARLFHQEQQRRRQLEAVRDVTAEIVRELDLTALLALIHRRAVELLGAASGALFLWDEAAQRLVVQISIRPEEWARAIQYRLGEGVSGAVAQRREGMIVNDYRTSPHANPLLIERTGITATMGEPLLYRDRLLGVLTLNHEEPARSFTEQDREVLVLLAAEAAIAIENARLFREEQRRRKQLEAVRAVTEEITRELHLPALLDLIYRRAADLVRAGTGTLYLWDAAAGEMVPQAWHSRGDWIREVRLPPGIGVAGTVAQRREGMIVNDYRTSPYALPVLLERTRIAASMAEPLLYRDRLVGVVVLNHDEGEGGFTQEDREILALFAGQAAVAIENAHLYAESRRSAREATALAEVARTLTRSLDMDQVLTAIVEELRQLTGVAFTGIMSLDPEREELAYVKGTGMSPDRMARIRLKLGEGIGGLALARREPLQSPAVRRDPRYASFGREPEGIQSLLTVPLLAGDRALGVLSLFRTDEHRFSEAEVDLATRFADQAALAIQNAERYQEERRRARDFAGLVRMARTVAVSADLGEVLESVVRSAVELTGAAVATLRLLEDGWLVRRACAGPVRDVAVDHGEADRFPAWRSVLGGVVSQGQFIWIPDLAADPRDALAAFNARHGLRWYLGVPLRGGDYMVGTLSVKGAQPRAMTDELRELLESLAAMAAGAISRLRPAA